MPSGAYPRVPAYSILPIRCSISRTQIEKINFPQEQTKEEEQKPDAENVPEDIGELYGKMDGDDEEDAEIRSLQLLTFEIKQESIETVQKRCIELEYPLLAE
ncbi:unnamed protein product, partial [Strongylus vulgaris]